MLRYLMVLGLVLSTGLEAKIPENSQRIIELGKQDGLKEVNEKQDKDHPRYRDKSGLAYMAPQGTWKPNPKIYGDKIHNTMPEYFFRTLKDCKTHKILDEQVIFTYNGYLNYIGGSRYQEQCVDDGSEDKYYEESIERLR